MNEHVNCNLTVPDPTIGELKNLHKAVTPLVQEAIRDHQKTVDCLCAIRFMLRLSPDAETNPFLAGIEDVITYIYHLKTVAMNYHEAIREL